MSRSTGRVRRILSSTSSSPEGSVTTSVFTRTLQPPLQAVDHRLGVGRPLLVAGESNLLLGVFRHQFIKGHRRLFQILPVFLVQGLPAHAHPGLLLLLLPLAALPLLLLQG